jgi:hypothetical protein
MQRRVILLHRRRARVDQEIERFLGRALDIDAAAAHLIERGADRLVARDHLRACVGFADEAAAAPAAHRLQPRHRHHLERLDELVDIDARRLLQLAHITLGQRPQPLGQQTQLELLAGARARDRVGGARCEEGPPPAAVARPAADRGAADARARGDLAIGQLGLLDQGADARDPPRRPAPRAGRARGGSQGERGVA